MKYADVSQRMILMAMIPVLMLALFGCSRQASDTEVEAVDDTSEPASDMSRTSTPGGEMALEINLEPDFDAIAKVMQKSQGSSQAIYDQGQGMMPDYVRFGISAMKPNRISVLAETGSELPGFNADGEWFGSGVKRERIEYAESDGQKTLVYEVRQLQSDIGKPPYELTAQQAEFAAETGLIHKKESVVYGAFDSTDETVLSLEESFDALKDLPGAQYESSEYVYELR